MENLRWPRFLRQEKFVYNFWGSIEGERTESQSRRSAHPRTAKDAQQTRPRLSGGGAATPQKGRQCAGSADSAREARMRMQNEEIRIILLLFSGVRGGTRGRRHFEEDDQGAETKINSFRPKRAFFLYS